MFLVLVFAEVLLGLKLNRQHYSKRCMRMTVFGLLMWVHKVPIIIQQNLTNLIFSKRMLLHTTMCCYNWANCDQLAVQLYEHYLINIDSRYFFGGVVWNLDNHICPTLTSLRTDSILPVPLRPFTQLHAWWHFFSGYGTYILMITFQGYRQK